jgi:hypothetical protein
VCTGAVISSVEVGFTGQDAHERNRSMPFIGTSEGTEIYYTDQGSERLVFSHGWLLSSDAW